jgi:hypothetical protein
LPETRERLERFLRASKGQPDFVPILAQINEHVVRRGSPEARANRGR